MFLTYLGILSSSSSASSGPVNYLFTPAGATGKNGPTLSQCQTAYAGQPFLASNFSVSSGKQILTISTGGVYRITAIGACGADTNPAGKVGGKSASMSGNFTLSAGDVITMLVGQKGSLSTNAGNPQSGGGGGGSFVLLNGILILAAGGGAGATANGNTFFNDGLPASTGTSGVNGSAGSGGTDGSGGGSTVGSALYSSGGGGYTGNGASSSYGQGGFSYTNGGTGGDGYNTASYNMNGGFGGGAGGGAFGGGGGGGYSGGGGGGYFGSAGGGGSYNTGSNQVNTIMTTFVDGSIAIQSV